MSSIDYPRPHARMHLNGFFPFGPIYRWDEVARPETYYEVESFAQLARTAERGLFTAIFLGDSQRLREHLGQVTDTAVTGRPDQLVLFAQLAALTERVGFVATLNATFSPPAELARRIATVESLSGGRLGWNVVTTDNAWTAENFRVGAHVGHEDRYRHATEHLAASHAVWDAWGASPQGVPVIFQAGESDEGRDFAVRHAEAIFSRYADLEEGRAFADDLTERLASVGRTRDELVIIPAMRIVLGASDDEAREKADVFERATWTDRRVIGVIEAIWGRALSDHPVDGPLPSFDPVVPEWTVTHGVVNSRDDPRTTATGWRALAEANGWSIRQLVAHLTRSIEIVGTPSAVADHLAHAVRSGAWDGLNLVPDSVPGGFDDVVDLLVPELQDRGVYPTEYPGETLRENLGIGAPVRDRLAAVGHAR